MPLNHLTPPKMKPIFNLSFTNWVDRSMEHTPITKEQAITMLSDWQTCGHELSSLMKITSNQSGEQLFLLIPGYQCNGWYQLGGEYRSYSAALAAYGSLLDMLSGS